MILARWWDTQFSASVSPQHSDWAAVLGQKCLCGGCGTQVGDWGARVEFKTKRPHTGGWLTDWLWLQAQKQLCTPAD